VGRAHKEDLEQHAFDGKAIKGACNDEVGILEVFDLDDAGGGAEVEGNVMPRAFA
jgi:hypothetical protein